MYRLRLDLADNIAGASSNDNKTNMNSANLNPDPNYNPNPDLDQSILSTSLLASNSTSSGGGSGHLDLNKLNLPMKEMFREQIKSYRDAVYMLTGYKVDLINGNDKRQLRLKSMYADASEDSILFQYVDNGIDLDLLETPFAQRISPQQFEYLNSCNSIPAFLSAVTLELFETTPCMGSSSSRSGRRM